MIVCYLWLVVMLVCRGAGDAQGLQNECFKYYNLEQGWEADNLIGKVASVESSIQYNGSPTAYIVAEQSYTQSGKPELARYYRRGKKLEKSIEYIYDDNGFVQEYTRSEQGMIIKHETLEHDQIGNVQKYKEYRNGKYISTTYTSSNANGDPVSVRTEYPSSESLQEYYHKYDENGLLMETTVIDSSKTNLNNTHIIEKQSYVYNTDGFLVEHESVSIELYKRKTVYELEGNCLVRQLVYNEDMDTPAEIILFNKNGTVRMSKTKMKLGYLEVKCIYEYDHMGNWISKEVFMRNDSEKEYESNSKEYRRITYY